MTYPYFSSSLSYHRVCPILCAVSSSNGRLPVQAFHSRLSLDELCPIQAARFAAWVGKHDRSTCFNRTPSAIDFPAGTPSTAIGSRAFSLCRTRFPQRRTVKTTEGNGVQSFCFLYRFRPSGIALSSPGHDLIATPAHRKKRDEQGTVLVIVVTGPPAPSPS